MIVQASIYSKGGRVLQWYVKEVLQSFQTRGMSNALLCS